MQENQELREQIKELQKENKQLYRDYIIACKENKNLKEIITSLEVKLTRKQKQLLEVQKLSNSNT